MNYFTEIRSTIAVLDDKRLAELETIIRDAREQKRERLDLGDITPNMSGEQKARVLAEIERLMAQGQ